MLNPRADVTLMENHDAAYHVWRAAGVRDRVLVHVDAHHDVAWANDGIPITIANFISFAIKAGIVRDVFWIVPDPTWRSAGDRAEIVRQLRNALKGCPDPPRSIATTKRGIVTSMMGRSLTVGPLDVLRGRIRERVLLDIDTDYLIVPRLYEDSDGHRRLPWCWPEELVDRLASLNVVAASITIPYSVEGGYTPLRWKYLGDELAERLGRRDPVALNGFQKLREGAQHLEGGARPDAEAAFLEAARYLPAHPAPPYLLSELYAADARETDARAAYRRAIDLDPTYRTPYRNSGLLYFREKRYVEAEAEHRRGLVVAPDDPIAYFGLGRLAALRRRWPEAEALLRRAIALDSAMLDAHRALGDVLARQQRHREAIEVYERSLLYAVRGTRGLAASIVTDVAGDRRLDDPYHGAVYARIGLAYARVGNRAAAVQSLGAAIKGRYDGVGIRCRMVGLHAAQGEWRRAAEHLGQAIRLAPAVSMAPLGRVWRRAGRLWRKSGWPARLSGWRPGGAPLDAKSVTS